MAIAHDLFEPAARMQAKAAGTPDIAIQVIPRPPQSATAEEILASNPTLPDEIAAHLLRQLSGPST